MQKVAQDSIRRDLGRGVLRVGKGLALSRRAMLLGTPSVLAASVGNASRNPDNGAKVLSDHERMLLRALVNAVIPVKQANFVSHENVGTVQNVEQLLGALDDDVLDGLRLSLRLLEWGSVVLGWRLTRMQNLPASECELYLREWLLGHFLQRGIAGTWAQLIMLSYWSSRETWDQVGYSGPTSRQYKIPSLGVAPMPVVQP